MGAVGEHTGARVALLNRGLAALAAAGIGLITARQQERRTVDPQDVPAA